MAGLSFQEMLNCESHCALTSEHKCKVHYLTYETRRVSGIITTATWFENERRKLRAAMKCGQLTSSPPVNA
jgi:hypothetical protein